MYKKMREFDFSLPDPVRQFLRIADNAVIVRSAMNEHPDWTRFLLETENETINIADADPLYVPSASEEWALDNAANRLKPAQKILYRIWKSLTPPPDGNGLNVQNTLIDQVLPVLDNNAGIKDYVITRKILEGIPGTTLTSANITGMTGAQRFTLLKTIEYVCFTFAISGLGGIASADKNE